MPASAHGLTRPPPFRHVSDAELTIDELSRATGMTVRNIRSHQSRGLLPPPEVRARTGYYGAEHVARLRLIQELQATGYNLAAIKHLIGRSQGSAEDVLGFMRTLLAPFEGEPAEVVELRELSERYGDDRKALGKAVSLGILVPLGEDRYEAPSPSLLRAADALVELGIPVEKGLEMVEQAGRTADGIGERFVKLLMERVWNDSATDWAATRDGLERLRPLVTEMLVAVFHQRMTAAVERAFGRELKRRAR
jgi:DNA-binding transcriptional MerR regulator